MNKALIKSRDNPLFNVIVVRYVVFSSMLST
ncbi:Uncharacterised protein [Shimwellia blattae]|nr:Uncharacterised protein [Shimwellia blattae]VEC22281.1 Uncharacterised protein [Shimwellia blattae]